MEVVIRRALAHVSPEELLLIPVVIIVAVAIFAQPTAITRLFESPFATPVPGDSPADVILGDRARTPAPAPSPVTAPVPSPATSTRGDIRVFDRTGALRLSVAGRRCPAGATLRELPLRLQPEGPVQTMSVCVDADGSVRTWDAASGTMLRRVLVPGSVVAP